MGLNFPSTSWVELAKLGLSKLSTLSYFGFALIALFDNLLEWTPRSLSFVATQRCAELLGRERLLSRPRETLKKHLSWLEPWRTWTWLMLFLSVFCHHSSEAWLRNIQNRIFIFMENITERIPWGNPIYVPSSLLNHFKLGSKERIETEIVSWVWTLWVCKREAGKTVSSMPRAMEGANI